MKEKQQDPIRILDCAEFPDKYLHWKRVSRFTMKCSWGSLMLIKQASFLEGAWCYILYNENTFGSKNKPYSWPSEAKSHLYSVNEANYLRHWLKFKRVFRTSKIWICNFYLFTCLFNFSLHMVHSHSNFAVFKEIKYFGLSNIVFYFIPVWKENEYK